MSLNQIVTIVIFAYMALWALFTALSACRHHWIMALLRTMIIIAATIVSVPLSKAISGQISHKLYGLITSWMDADMLKLVNDVPLAAESVQLIVTLILTPLVFLVTFLLLRGIVSLLVIILEKVIPFLHHKKVYNMAIALPVGVMNGLLIALVTLIPLVGYVGLATDTLADAETALEESGKADVLSEDHELISATQDRVAILPLSDGAENDAVTELDPVFDIAHQVGDGPVVDILVNVGDPLFDWMTTGKLQEGQLSFSLSDELSHLAASSGELVAALERFEDENIHPDDKAALMESVDHMLESDWLSAIAAEAIGVAAETWLEGESFLGMEAPDLGELIQPSFNVALTVLTSENADNLHDDMITVLDIVTDLMMMGLLEDDPDYEALMAELGESGLLNSVMGKLKSNPHMAPLASEVQTLTVRVVSSVLGETLKNTEEYDPMINDVAAQLNDVIHMTEEEREPIVREAIKNAFVDYGVNVPEDVALEFSEKAIAEVGEDGEVNADELKQYLIDNIDEGIGLADGVIDGGEDITIPDPGF